MIRKRLLSACLALALCLSLLPVTALAADGIELYVGGQKIIESGCYANQNGTWTKVEGTGPSSGQFYYDAATFTLTLNQAEITHDQTVTVAEGYNYQGSVIAFSQTDDVSLKIVVSQGTSTITGTGGIRVESTTGNASLSIKGSGSLDVKPNGSNSGITLCSSKNTNLDIDGADVTASSPALYGVYLISSTDASSTSTITVNNGSLTTGGNGNVGIYYYWSGTNNAGTSSLTVSGNAVVDTRNSQIMAQNKETVVRVGAGSDGNGGIVFDGTEGTVYGKVELQDDLTINEGETLTVGKDASLTVPDGKTLTNNGTVTTEEGGTLTGNITNAPPKITTESLDEGEVDKNYSQTLIATGDNITWSVTSGNLPTELSLSGNTISGTPTTANTYKFTVTATNNSGSDSKEYTLTINPAPILVSSVKLNKSELSLYTGQSEPLTATVTPNDATNKKVTWSSDNESVATVNDGVVTAVGAGKATITATADGKSATCTVTVTAATVPVTGVTMNKTSTSLYVGDTETLTATVQPGNASNQTVTWSTSDASVATVENGVVRATGRGTATITVTTVDGGFTADCTVTVSRYSTGGGPTTYAVTAPDAENGTVRVSPSRASRGTTVTITVTPDEGYELESLTVLDSRDNEIPLTDKGDGKYTFTMPSGRVTVEASFAEIAPEPLSFGDVDDGDWFADAVRFVYENGMMNGVSETSFAPHATTSRSMIVTILYRLEGEPVVDYAMDFTDVAGDAYYAEAVRWAASEGIVGGYGGGLFGAEDAVTREQLAVILYRYAVYKGYDVSIGESTNILSYADFADLSEYAIPAMQWACGSGIVNGTSESTLAPQGEATRAQVAAMLMRFCESIVQ